MRIVKYSGIIILVLFAILGLYSVVSTVSVFFGGANRIEDTEGLATTDKPLVSPSGKYQLEIAGGNNGLVHFERFYISRIRGKGIEPEVIYASTDTFRTRDTLFFLWDKVDRVWVYSGDAGVFYWTKATDNRWEKHIYKNEPIPAPELLKKLKPEIFDNQ